MDYFGMNDFFKKSFQFQQDMAQKWMGMMAQPAGEAAQEGAPVNPIENMANLYKDMYNQWAQQVSANPMLSSLLPGGSAITDNPMVDMFNKMMNSGKSLADLSAFYQKLAAAGPLSSREAIDKFVADNEAAFNRLSQDVLLPFLPENLKPLFAQSNDLLKQMTDINKGLLKPWMALNGAEVMQKLANKDTSALPEFFRTMTEAYQDSYGKIFNAAGLGLTREQNEAIMTQFDSYYQMVIALAEMLALVGEVSKDSMITIIEQFQKMAQEGKAPQSLREFYNIWCNVNEQAFEKLFATDQFARVFCAFAQKSCLFKIKLDKVLENTLSWAPFPKNSEMKNLYKTVYDLRKSDYFNTKKNAALEEQVAALKASVDELAKLVKKGDK